MTDKETLNVIKKNVRNFYYDPTDTSDEILQLMQADGSFSDLDYQNQNWTSWPPYLHLCRVSALCRMVSCSQNKIFGDKTVKLKIHDLLGYFIRGNFHSENWWQNDVGVPMECTVILLLFSEELTKEEHAAVQRYAEGNPSLPRGFTYNSNQSADGLRPYQSQSCHMMSQLVDTHKYVVSQGYSAEKAMIAIRDCLRAVDWELSVVTWAPGFGPHGLYSEEHSIKADYSYHEHENCVEPNSYGNGMIENLADLFSFWRGTQLRLAEKTVKTLANLLLDGYRYMRYRGFSPMMLLGRDACSVEFPSYYRISLMKAFVTICDTLLSDYPNVPRRDELQHFRSCMAEPDAHPYFCGSKYFWESDLLSHNRAQYQFTVHGTSTRLKRPESILKKNVQGMFLGDGCYNLLQSGREYEQIQMCMDWRRLPGITSNLNVQDAQLNPESEIDTQIDTLRLFGGAHGTREYAGGASDGVSGFFAMDYAHLGVCARKAWFCFDEGIFCLGAGITAENGAHAYTTLNQCKGIGTVVADGIQLQKGAHTQQNCHWVLHDGVGYILPQRQTVHIQNQLVVGSWRRVDRDSGTDEAIGKPIFLLGIDHGEKAENESYAYFLLPGATAESVSLAAENLPLCVLQNNRAVQAVYKPETGELHAVFYQRGSVCFGQSTLTVNEPCAILFKPRENGYRFYISNPLHTAKTVRLALNGVYQNTLLCRLTAGFRCNNLGRPLAYDSDLGFLPHSGAQTEEV